MPLEISYRDDRLLPVDQSATARTGKVRFVSNIVVRKGQILGQVAGGADDGKWNIYDPSATDGTEVARAISMRAIATDDDGNICTIDDANVPAVAPPGPYVNGYGFAETHGEVYRSGRFRTSELVGLDSSAIGFLGGLEEGSLGNGILRVG